MKILSLIKYLILFFLCYAAKLAGAQQRLVMSGGYINIANGATLIVGNSSTNAIVRNTGYIITEGENNTLKWNTGTTTGTYTIPLGYSANYIPVTFTKTAGTGNGYISFSTYHTGWNNAAMLPAGVLNVNYNGADNSAFTIDRFWKIDAGGYTAKPTITNLLFTYLMSEVTASGNSITESTMGAQRWNSTINDWGDFIPGVTINTTNKTLTVPTVGGNDLFKWWTLPGLSGNHFLPVELTSFKGECSNGSVNIQWHTASEINNDHFTLEKSSDGINWTAVTTIPGAGNSNSPLDYSTTDETTSGETYYRLQQTDFNGRSIYSSIIQLTCGEVISNAVATTVYPNPSTGIFNLQHAPVGATLSIRNPLGELVLTDKITSTDQQISLENISNGIYILTLYDGKIITTHKLMVQK
ncbi:MAG: type sorting protein [Bacteroidota bacterium]|nr:type sorting protein [Bacteroidota bacterium]